MILKFETDVDDLYLLESTANRGVSLTRWSQIGELVGDFYDHIVFRQLKTEREDQMLERLEVFLKEAIGLSYGISTA